mgnify:CR=1 FL=1
MEVFNSLWNTISGILSESGLMQLFVGDGWKNLIMLAVSCFLIYLAIAKKFEPLLLLPIAFGMLLTNLPGAGMFHPELWYSTDPNFVISYSDVLHKGGVLDILYIGVKAGLFPPLIFLGIGCMTDFGPLISNPKSFLLGAAAQLGIFVAFLGALALNMSPQLAGAIGIIGGADGPTAILVASKLAPNKLGAIAVAAYSYMALIPFIQRPIMLALTTKKERLVRMEQTRVVSRTEKIIFPIMVTIVVSLILPAAAPLIGMLMLGNLMRESGVVERINKTAQNELMNIITIFLGLSVGATTSAATFLNLDTLKIILMGLVAFAFGTAGGVLLGKLMYIITKGKVNPLIGSAGVSAVPMAARVSQKVGQECDPGNYLLMHAMGPNVSGVIGSAVAAGILLSMIPAV